MTNIFSVALPEIIILISAMSVLLLGVYFNNKNSTSLFGITQLTLLLSAYFTAQLPMDSKLLAFGGMFISIACQYI